MAVVVLLRGVNVGGRRRLRPSLLAQRLRAYEVVNIGAAGTLVARKPGPTASLCAALAAELPFETAIVLCSGPEFLRAVSAHPFGEDPPAEDETRFLTILAKPARLRQAAPFQFPGEGDWLVRVLAIQGRFVYGVYRRHLKTIGCLAQLDRMCRVAVTTRNWNTVQAVAKALSGT